MANKMKSNSGAKKRFKRTGGGKFKHASAGKRHLNTNKPRKRKKGLKANVLVDDTQQHQIERLLPYK
jgi:large subunit ribosomal protein L35